MSKYHITTVAIAMIYLLLTCCSKKQAEEIKPENPGAEIPATPVSYAATIQPLFQSRCAGCHAPGRSAAGIWTFNGIASLTSNASRIKDVVLVRKSMPLGGTLSAAELKSIQDWFDQGMLP